MEIEIECSFHVSHSCTVPSIVKAAKAIGLRPIRFGQFRGWYNRKNVNSASFNVRDRYGRVSKRVPCVMKNSNGGKNHQRQKSVQAICDTFVRRTNFLPGAHMSHVLRRALLPALLILATLAIAACTGQCVDSFDCPRDEDVKYTCIDKTCQVRPDDETTDGGTL